MKVRAALLLALASAVCGLPPAADAQQARKVPRIGLLSVAPFPGERDVLILKGLEELGWIEGRTVVFERRSAPDDSALLAAHARELVRMKVDLIVAITSPAIQAAKDATTSIPIVMAPSGDAIATGFVKNLARPGGNITGVTFAHDSLGAKRLELLREVHPGLARVAVLTALNLRSLHEPMWKSAELAARSLGISVHQFEVRNAREIELTILSIARERMEGLVVLPSGLFALERGRIAELAQIHRLASICDRAEYVKAGCLMSYGGSLADILRRAASHIDKILKGAKPGDLPVEQPSRFELVINLKTAKALGLTIAQSMLVRADEVIQ